MLWHVRNGDWLGTCRFVHLDWVANLVRQLADELGVEDDEHVAALHFVDNALLDFNLHLRRHNVSQKKRRRRLHAHQCKRLELAVLDVAVELRGQHAKARLGAVGDFDPVALRRAHALPAERLHDGLFVIPQIGLLPKNCHGGDGVNFRGALDAGTRRRARPSALAPSTADVRAMAPGVMMDMVAAPLAAKSAPPREGKISKMRKGPNSVSLSLRAATSDPCTVNAAWMCAALNLVCVPGPGRATLFSHMSRESGRTGSCARAFFF